MEFEVQTMSLSFPTNFEYLCELWIVSHENWVEILNGQSWFDLQDLFGKVDHQQEQDWNGFQSQRLDKDWQI